MRGYCLGRNGLGELEWGKRGCGYPKGRDEEKGRSRGRLEIYLNERLESSKGTLIGILWLIEKLFFLNLNFIA